MLTAIFVVSTAGLLPAQSFLLLGAPFGEHMVLQQGAPIAIWGTGCPGGDTVRAWLKGQSRTGQCDWKGNWMVEFAPMTPGGPYQLLMEIGGYGPLVPSSAANGRGGIELNDVLIGEVVLAAVSSGPTLSETKDGANDIAAAKLPWIRMLNSSGRWTAVSPAAAGGFSATAFYLARALYERLKIPIGVIDRPDGTLCTPLQARYAPTACGAQ
jgi:sialate O-acetylesterase